MAQALLSAEDVMLQKHAEWKHHHGVVQIQSMVRALRQCPGQLIWLLIILGFCHTRRIQSCSLPGSMRLSSTVGQVCGWAVRRHLAKVQVLRGQEVRTRPLTPEAVMCVLLFAGCTSGAVTCPAPSSMQDMYVYIACPALLSMQGILSSIQAACKMAAPHWK